MRNRVILESPYAGNVELHLAYLKLCIRDSILHYNEAPIASHALYIGALNDDNPEERKIGIERFWLWHDVADAMVVYQDFGISKGMNYSIAHAREIGLRIHYRNIGTRIK